MTRLEIIWWRCQLWNCRSSGGSCVLSLNCWLNSDAHMDTAWSICQREKIVAVGSVVQTVFPLLRLLPHFFRTSLRSWNMLILYFDQFFVNTCATFCDWNGSTYRLLVSILPLVFPKRLWPRVCPLQFCRAVVHCSSSFACRDDQWGCKSWRNGLDPQILWEWSNIAVSQLHFLYRMVALFRKKMQKL